jgi:hydrogenase nickel incorporation protein HypA/HybF
MHEYSLVRALLDRVDASAREHGATTVAALRVRIGEVAGVEAELFTSAFELAKRGTRCAAAELELVSAAARWQCTSCGASAPRGGVLRCAVCGEALCLAAGDEIVLERIEMEVG